MSRSNNKARSRATAVEGVAAVIMVDVEAIGGVVDIVVEGVGEGAEGVREERL